ncbi:MAG TPA: transcriptional repressor LexA [Chloroflexia bacterium]|nr:transcriptional repressor LexA [Chloroflexia bacterium]
MTIASASRKKANRADKAGAFVPSGNPLDTAMHSASTGPVRVYGSRRKSVDQIAGIVVVEADPPATVAGRGRSGGRRKMNQLSKKQQDILSYIENYIEENNWPPTVREIQMALSISSTSVVDYNLDALENKGHIIRKSGKSRAIELVKRTRRGQTEYIPVLGTIAAGLPIPDRKDADPEDQLEIPSYMLKGRPGPDVFALRVKGDSMIDALIADGDIVLIRSAETAEIGETVAVWLESEGETTLKQWYPEPQHGRVRLQPANSTMKPIYTAMDNARVRGKLVGVIRSIL